MSKKIQSPIIRSNRMGILAVVCGIALIASACGGAAVNSTGPTPGTNNEAAPTTEASAEVSTDTPAELPQTSAADMDACSLITSAEAEAVMGQPVETINPYSELDTDYGETVFSCFYLGNELSIMVSKVELGSAQAASEAMQQQLIKEQTDSEDAIITEEPGLGEKAYWTTVENAGIFSFLKGRTVLVVGLVGISGDVESYKPSLLVLAKSISAKY